MKLHIGLTDYVFAAAVALVIVGIVIGNIPVLAVGIAVGIIVFIYAVYSVLTRKSGQLKAAAAQKRKSPADGS
jgi:uncharacterized membrane protein YcaP (DUF421 family)